MRPRADAAPSFVFVDTLPAAGGVLTFGEEESHYLGKVVRSRIGESVTATDGCGVRADVVLTSVGRTCEGRVARRDVLPRHRTLVMACGVPEGDRGDWLIEKAAELGVSAFQPLDTERGRWDRMAARVPRWQRLARAALRQSRACWSLELAPVRTLSEWLADAPMGERVFADPAGSSAATRPARGAGSTLAAVGPSSGFTDSERKALEAQGFRSMALAGSRLRTETAALAVAAWWAAAEGA